MIDLLLYNPATVRSVKVG